MKQNTLIIVLLALVSVLLVANLFKESIFGTSREYFDVQTADSPTVSALPTVPAASAVPAVSALPATSAVPAIPAENLNFPAFPEEKINETIPKSGGLPDKKTGTVSPVKVEKPTQKPNLALPETVKTTKVPSQKPKESPPEKGDKQSGLVASDSHSENAGENIDASDEDEKPLVETETKSVPKGSPDIQKNPPIESVDSPTDKEHSAPKTSTQKTSNSKTSASNKSAKTKKSGDSKETKQVMTNDQRNAIVAINGKSAAGTGFFAKFQGRFFIVSNVHVMCGIQNAVAKTMTGESSQVIDKVFSANDRDIALFPVEKIPEGCHTLTFDDDPSKRVQIGDDVVICGNSLGGGTMTETCGKIASIGPDMIETDCKIFPGNSGSPILHVKSGKVIGVISHLVNIGKSTPDYIRNAIGKKNSAIKYNVRYFGYRIDNVPKWEFVNCKTAFQQTETLEQAEKKFDFMLKCLKSGIGVPHPPYRDIARAWEKARNEYTSSGSSVRDFYLRLAQIARNDAARIRSMRVYETFEKRKNKVADALETYQKSVYQYLKR